MKPTPKEQYEAQRALKRIARGDDPEQKTLDELREDMLYSMAERFVAAFEQIAVNLGQRK